MGRGGPGSELVTNNADKCQQDKAMMARWGLQGMRSFEFEDSYSKGATGEASVSELTGI
jgi:hypothetical protein